MRPKKSREKEEVLSIEEFFPFLCFSTFRPLSLEENVIFHRW